MPADINFKVTPQSVELIIKDLDSLTAKQRSEIIQKVRDSILNLLETDFGGDPNFNDALYNGDDNGEESSLPDCLGDPREDDGNFFPDPDSDQYLPDSETYDNEFSLERELADGATGPLKQVPMRFGDYNGKTPMEAIIKHGEKAIRYFNDKAIPYLERNLSKVGFVEQLEAIKEALEVGK